MNVVEDMCNYSAEKRARAKNIQENLQISSFHCFCFIHLHLMCLLQKDACVHKKSSWNFLNFLYQCDTCSLGIKALKPPLTKLLIQPNQDISSDLN
ncbi:hypothetical protein BC936DRAFT_149786 [Jimgerdemannia flammicorona]|uniref:Uncharacterized protein n=1 Tax=Jimgerdemannia flammicorona TaxID=994334 RepID=A0A433D073_9FUNG|nr:hypothetical protein BC936DRAFT_149786 [Jimgerdemannia flammicorona]